ncbi:MULTISPECIES: SU10 major capsid protein [Prauserella salsuginis group]|uniref:Major capsid protein n=2 Tax=Prauserella salsuginis group TaxID=2893672 RepID=A0A839Y3A9_9PSEU|nr:MULTISPECIES: DUF5309 family protein [Prauserella salsuginis group]MBB3666405.1 hypothetical protein [Prauserella sediminis]MCR3719143.1 hypothetical protein [Prauserella flava]MCR3735844.1 hypothetical protein [Prauserella salsuginis]
MASVTGLGTTYDLPNYTGILHQLTPSDTPFFSAIGGLTGGGQTTSTEFEWQTFDLRSAGQNTKVEGAEPEDSERTRANVTNVVQIHQESVGVSYSKLAAPGQKAGTNNEAQNPIRNELDWQVEQMLKQMVRDVEYSSLRGTYQKPADNTTARQTRGLLPAITTNVINVDSDGAGASGPLTDTLLLDLMQSVYDNGGLMEAETATIIVNSFQKRQLTKIFVADKGYQEQSRNVGGVNVQTIETDFGRVNVMLDRHMPADQVAVASLDQCRPVFLEVPGKGHFFAEPLAKTGAKDRTQLYGEVGLEYGAESAHGKITNLSTTPQA